MNKKNQQIYTVAWWQKKYFTINWTKGS